MVGALDAHPAAGNARAHRARTDDVVGGAVMSPALPLQVEVISDVVCPWCYVGKRRLEQAMALADMPLVVRWRPYQLDPTIPPQGKPRREYLAQKFGSAERIDAMHARIAA